MYVRPCLFWTLVITVLALMTVLVSEHLPIRLLTYPSASREDRVMQPEKKEQHSTSKVGSTHANVSRQSGQRGSSLKHEKKDENSGNGPAADMQKPTQEKSGHGPAAEMQKPTQKKSGHGPAADMQKPTQKKSGHGPVAGTQPCREQLSTDVAKGKKPTDYAARLRALVTHTGPRPSWMPMPPIEAIFPQGHKHCGCAGEPNITLVSTAIGEKYERALPRLKAFAAANGFSHTLLWKSADVQRHAKLLAHPQASAFFNLKGHPRPYCAAFKPLQLLNALQTSCDGDYVMWTDASKHHSEPLGIDVRGAAKVLREGHRNASSAEELQKNNLAVSSPWATTRWFEKRHRQGWDRSPVGSAYGLLHCPADCRKQTYLNNKASRNVNRQAFKSAYWELIKAPEDDFFSWPAVLDSNILLRNGPETRLLIWDWLSMALGRPKEWCMSQTTDQGAWTVLVLSRRLPLVNTCIYFDNCDWHTPSVANSSATYCSWMSKNVNVFLSVISSGWFEVVRGSEYDDVQHAGKLSVSDVHKACQISKHFPR
eukprot:TRINITY_DN13704_c0_g1_i1.p1 TRINITY_DN13704_c0_g1~~TRINITY_DN13704_c0_g1_i1.p1  ORF type:complete len:539 (-),score=54.11 TRINITY_DN13704_c0_g1_i1:44-1660(-)